MNLRTIFLKNTPLFLFAGLLIFAGRTAFAVHPAKESKEKAVEINAAEQRIIEAAKKTGPIAEIKEEENHVPEVPQPITRKHLGPAEQARLAELERKRASGKITETEYNLEKDTLFRKANIIF